MGGFGHIVPGPEVYCREVAHVQRMQALSVAWRSFCFGRRSLAMLAPEADETCHNRMTTWRLQAQAPFS